MQHHKINTDKGQIMKLHIQNGKTIIFYNGKLLSAADTPSFDFNYSFLSLDMSDNIIAKNREDDIALSDTDKSSVIDFFEKYTSDDKIVYLMSNCTTALEYLRKTDHTIIKLMEKQLCGLYVDKNSIHEIVQKRNEARSNLFFINPSKNKNIAYLLTQEC
jgi:hypothetical protein